MGRNVWEESSRLQWERYTVFIGSPWHLVPFLPPSPQSRSTACSHSPLTIPSLPPTYCPHPQVLRFSCGFSFMVSFRVKSHRDRAKERSVEALCSSKLLESGLFLWVSWCIILGPEWRPLLQWWNRCWHKRNQLNSVYCVCCVDFSDNRQRYQFERIFLNHCLRWPSQCISLLFHKLCVICYTFLSFIFLLLTTSSWWRSSAKEEKLGSTGLSYTFLDCLAPLEYHDPICTGSWGRCTMYWVG